MDIENTNKVDSGSLFVEGDVVMGYGQSSAEKSIFEDIKVEPKAEEVKEEPIITKTDDELAEELAKSLIEEDKPEEKTEEKETKKPLSKEESKIIALKKQNQKLLEDYREATKKLEDIETNKRKDELKKKYLDRGIDDEEAENYAHKDIEADKTVKRLEMLEFKFDNDEVLRQYPDSNGDLARIVSAVKSTGMTVEQVCRGLYGYTDTVRDARARQAATGDIDEEVKVSSVTSAEKASIQKSDNVLSRKDVEAKQKFENAFRNGQKMTNAEWLDRKKKYNINV